MQVLSLQSLFAQLISWTKQLVGLIRNRCLISRPKQPIDFPLESSLATLEKRVLSVSGAIDTPHLLSFLGYICYHDPSRSSLHFFLKTLQT